MSQYAEMIKTLRNAAEIVPGYVDHVYGSVFAAQFAEAADALSLIEAERDKLREALTASREAIASLDKWQLGEGGTGDPDNPSQIWPLRDELLHNIDAALHPTDNDRGARTPAVDAETPKGTEEC